MVRLDIADSFESFYDEWHPFAVLVAWASVEDDDVAKDLTQRIFVRLWRSGEWRGLRSPGHYLRQAVRNEVISWSRRRTFLPLSTLSELELGHPSGGPEERLLLAEARGKLVALFKRLPPRCSQAMTLRYCHGLSNREIAGQMDIGIRRVEKHMARGRRYLRTPGLKAELRAILDTLIAVGGGERQSMRPRGKKGSLCGITPRAAHLFLLAWRPSMKRVLLLLSFSCAVAASGLIVSPSTVLAQELECEWCHIDFCGGTSVCNHTCEEEEGDFQLEGCEEHPEGCEGETCFPDEQQLPDQTTVALVRDCALSTESAGVIADAWRGLYSDASVRPDEVALIGGWGW